MPVRFDNRSKQWVNVTLAGPNPTEPPPVEPGFLYHLDVISNRIGRGHRPYWMRNYGCWGIQAKMEDGEWRTVFMAYNELTAHKGNEYPFMPLDLRVIDEFASACLEIRYNTGNVEKDRQMESAERDERIAAEAAADDQRGVEDIAQRLTRGIGGGEEDHKRAAKMIRHQQQIGDGTGFVGHWQVPAKIEESKP